MKTRIIAGNFSSVAFEPRLKAVQPPREELSMHATMPTRRSRHSVERALLLLASSRSALGSVSSAVTGREIKLDCEADGRELTGLLESSLVKQRLATQPCRPVLHPPAGLASQPAGGADFFRCSHAHENTDHR